MSGTHAVQGALPPHLAESGIVTERELRLTERWVAAVPPSGAQGTPDGPWLDRWLGTGLPFSFRYGGQRSADILDPELFEETASRSEPGFELREHTWEDQKTGLAVVWQLKRFTAFPAVEWVLSFENRGARDTALIEDAQALDLRLNHAQIGRPYLVHGAEGGRSKPDDMMPFSQPLPGAVGQHHVQLGADFPSSNRHLPFFNLETPEGHGVMGG